MWSYVTTFHGPPKSYLEHQKLPLQASNLSVHHINTTNSHKNKKINSLLSLIQTLYSRVTLYQHYYSQQWTSYFECCEPKTPRLTSTYLIHQLLIKRKEEERRDTSSPTIICFSRKPKTHPSSTLPSSSTLTLPWTTTTTSNSNSSIHISHWMLDRFKTKTPKWTLPVDWKVHSMYNYNQPYKVPETDLECNILAKTLEVLVAIHHPLHSQPFHRTSHLVQQQHQVLLQQVVALQVVVHWEIELIPSTTITPFYNKAFPNKRVQMVLLYQQIHFHTFHRNKRFVTCSWWYIGLHSC